MNPNNPPKNNPPQTPAGLVVVRRLPGFVIQFNDEDCQVGLVYNGKVFEYDLPAAQLRNAGLAVPNQPFELTELRSADPAVFGVLYSIRRLANKEDAFIESLTLTAADKRKLARIIKYFSTKGDGKKTQSARPNFPKKAVQKLDLRTANPY